MHQYESVFTVDDDRLPECHQLMPPHFFTGIDISEADVFYSLKQMSSSNACGPDDIHPSLIRNAKCHFVYPLKLLFSESLKTGQVPDDWKNAIIIPSYKNNQKPSDPASYRPISLTCVISKLIERIVHKNIVSYLLNNCLISPNQHGFLKKRSTTTNMISCLNKWTKLIDEKSSLDVIYLDLQKAFDKVSHKKLLYKLKKLGFEGKLLEWIKNFLTERKQCVKVENHLSGYSLVESGIPQGTILGPLLFNIFINGLSSETENCDLQLYADDSKIYRKVNSEHDKETLQRELDKIHTFLTDWQLLLNQGKSEVLHVGHGNKSFQYEIAGEEVVSKELSRDLGINVSNDLSFGKHCSTVARSAYYRIKQFNTGFSCNDKDFKLFIYKTYIRPIVESSTQVWSPHLLKDIDAIEKVQKFFTRQLPGMRHLNYTQRLQDLNLQSLEERRIYFDLLLAFKIIKGFVDISASDFFEFSASRTRGHIHKIQIKHSRLNTRKYFFTNRVAPIWNSLPVHIVSCNTVYSFKNAMKNYNLKPFCRGRTLIA